MSGRFLPLCYAGLGVMSALVLLKSLPRQLGPSESPKISAVEGSMEDALFKTDQHEDVNRLNAPWMRGLQTQRQRSVEMETTNSGGQQKDQTTDDVMREFRENEIKSPLMVRGGGPNATAIEYYGLSQEQIYRIKELQQRLIEKARKNFHDRMSIIPNVQGCAYAVEYVRDKPFYDALRNEFLKAMGDIAGTEFAEKSAIWLKSDFMGSQFDTATQLRFYVAPEDPEIMQPLEIAPGGYISIADGTPVVRVQELHRGEPRSMTSEVTIGQLAKMNIFLPAPQDAPAPGNQ